MLPESIQKFVALFSRLPSIGPRQATRLAFHIIRRGRGTITDLAEAISGLARIATCPQCFLPHELKSHENNLCDICSNVAREQDLIAIVEKETDLISLEKSRAFTGRYFILGEVGRDGVLDTEQKLRLKSLKNHIEKTFGKAKEIVIALNPTTIGDMEAGALTQELSPVAEIITRLGRGLPTGGEIEFADEDTLGGALENRR